MKVEITFLIAGHTKNNCDGAFGIINKRLRTSNFKHKKDMIRVIAENYTSEHLISSRLVQWFLKKDFLSQYFTSPSSLKIHPNQIFECTAFVEPLSTSYVTETKFNIFKRDVTAYSVSNVTPLVLQNFK